MDVGNLLMDEISQTYPKKSISQILYLTKP